MGGGKSVPTNIGATQTVTCYRKDTLSASPKAGIGVELSTAMRLFRYDDAAAVILIILVAVIGFEQLSSAIRHRIIGSQGGVIG
jgi:ABC-type nitrate/sulfonate/bicarbonate transport system permease component